MIEKINDAKACELFGGEFELVYDGIQKGQFNMDYDELRTKALACSKGLPMFRLYGWQPWCVSLGANQKEEEISKEECKKKNFDVVRRPTGGRAVLHAEELTYSVVMQLPEGKTVHDAYRDIHIILLEGIKRLGCKELSFQQSQPDFRSLYKQSGMSVSCFASSARYEIEHEGRKIVGSAQRLFGSTLLQHGSILLGDGHSQLADVANLSSEEKKVTLKKFMLAHSCTLSELCQRQISFEESATAMIDEVKS